MSLGRKNGFNVNTTTATTTTTTTTATATATTTCCFVCFVHRSAMYFLTSNWVTPSGSRLRIPVHEKKIMKRA